MTDALYGDVIDVLGHAASASASSCGPQGTFASGIAESGGHTNPRPRNRRAQTRWWPAGNKHGHPLRML